MATIPSIAMIPSGYKAGKLYSVLPTDGAGDFTTTRASVATRVNENGLLEEVAANVPRLDYSDGGCPSLLLEPTATNVETNSNDIGAWASKVSATATSNFGVSPDGTSNSNRVVFSANGYIDNRINQVNAIEYTVSVYAKRNDANTQAVGFFVNGSGVIDSQFAITSDWARYTYTYTSNNTFYAGIAGDLGADISLFGFQREQNSYATSYIPTSGTAQTRVADTASGSGNSTVINSSEGVLYFEISALADDVGSTKVLSISDGTVSNSLYSGYNSASNRIQAQIVVGGVAQTSMIHTVTDRTDFIKVAILYQNNNHKMFVNGVEVATDILGSVPSANTFNTLNFNLGQGSFAFYGKTKSLQVYTTALSDLELTNLTKI